jgi:hypothetical protein
VEKEGVVVFETWIDMVAISAFVYFVHWLSGKQDHLVDTVDKNCVTIEDYTVRVRVAYASGFLGLSNCQNSPNQDCPHVSHVRVWARICSH